MVECAILANTLIQSLKAARIDRFTFEREHSEGALMYAVQWLFADESF
jgi:hypothetical protein